jgi:hypothetical protein
MIIYLEILKPVGLLPAWQVACRDLLLVSGGLTEMWRGTCDI